MKKSIFLTLGLLTMLSCSSDDSSSGSDSSNLIVNGNSYVITSAKAVDNYNLFTNTHSEYNFILSDGIIDLSALIPGTLFGFTVEDASIAINLSIASVGQNFTTGTYVFDLNMESEYPDFNFFDGFTIYVDGNGDGDFYDIQDSILYGLGGTVTVSGTAPNYVLEMNIDLSNGETFEYTYSGGFEYVDNRGNDEDEE